jgi:hypothetical protein
VPAKQRLQRALNDAREYGHLEAAQDEEMYQAGCYKRVLKVGRDASPDA